MRLSMAWASTLEKGSTVVASRDTSRAARVLKRALSGGCSAAGVAGEDLEVATVPVTPLPSPLGPRSGWHLLVRLFNAATARSVVIRFFDQDGIDIAEAAQRKIGPACCIIAQEFRRALASCTSRTSACSRRALELYTAALTDTVDVDSIARYGFKMVLDYSFGTASFVMPNVLAKLGADVLVVNPYAATAAVVASDRANAAAHVADLVRASGAHLGAVIDPSGEQLTLVDDEGRVFTHDEALLLLLDLVVSTTRRAKVALPVASPMAAEQICLAYEAQINWTKLSATHLMEVASAGGVTFAASQMGGYIFPRFLPAFDAVGTLVHLLDMLARTDESISKRASRLPAIHIVHEEVVTPWEQKGTVMRTMVERAQRRDVILVDGIKLPEPDGWTLVVPDPEEPVTHVWAEAPTEAEARARAQEHAIRIRQMMR